MKNEVSSYEIPAPSLCNMEHPTFVFAFPCTKPNNETKVKIFKINMFCFSSYFYVAGPFFTGVAGYRKCKNTSFLVTAIVYVR